MKKPKPRIAPLPSLAEVQRRTKELNYYTAPGFVDEMRVVSHPFFNWLNKLFK
jgi:hypothetical protein